MTYKKKNNNNSIKSTLIFVVKSNNEWTVLKNGSWTIEILLKTIEVIYTNWTSLLLEPLWKKT